MGELMVAMNGVEFRTRHNDYKLRMPCRNCTDYNKIEDIPFPDVPPSVLAKSNLTVSMCVVCVYIVCIMCEVFEYYVCSMCEVFVYYMCSMCVLYVYNVCIICLLCV